MVDAPISRRIQLCDRSPVMLSRLRDFRCQPIRGLLCRLDFGPLSRAQIGELNDKCGLTLFNPQIWEQRLRRRPSSLVGRLPNRPRFVRGVRRLVVIDRTAKQFFQKILHLFADRASETDLCDVIGGSMRFIPLPLCPVAPLDGKKTIAVKRASEINECRFHARSTTHRVLKYTAGRLLDGRTWNEYPGADDG